MLIKTLNMYIGQDGDVGLCYTVGCSDITWYTDATRYDEAFDMLWREVSWI